MGTPPPDTVKQPPDRDSLTRRAAGKVIQKLRTVLPNKPNEADLRHAIEPLFDGFCLEAGIPPLAHAEFSLASGTADAVFSRFTIEYKRPGTLSANFDLATRGAVDQLHGYIRDLAVKEKPEANYLCLLINTSSASFAARTYSQEGGKSFGDPHVLDHIRIPKYDPKDKVHKRLAELSMQAHELAKTPASDKPQAASRKLEEVEAEVDLESAKLWNLTPSDLAEIQRSLKELTE